jgi:anaphase-promoting complex subunit 7
VTQLIDDKLWDSAELLGSFLICASRSSQTAHSESLTIYADALYGKEEYRRALVIVRARAHSSRRLLTDNLVAAHITELLQASCPAPEAGEQPQAPQQQR